MKKTTNTQNDIRIEKYQNSQDVISNNNERSSTVVNPNSNEMNEFLDQSFKWIKTPLCDFGFKCIQSEHSLCNWKECKCLCH